MQAIRIMYILAWMTLSYGINFQFDLISFTLRFNLNRCAFTPEALEKNSTKHQQIEKGAFGHDMHFYAL